MKTCLHSIACAAIRQPSIRRCGTRERISRSLKLPGSDSSALTTRYFGFGAARLRWHERPLAAGREAGAAAAAQLRREQLLDQRLGRQRARLRERLRSRRSPRTRRASSGRARRCRRGRSATRAHRSSSTIAGTSSGLTCVPVAVVDRDDRRPAAAAEALDRAERDLAVARRLAGPAAELALERLDDLLRADERAREVRADLDEVLADGLEVEHVVERRDRLAVGGRQRRARRRPRGSPRAAASRAAPARGAAPAAPPSASPRRIAVARSRLDRVVERAAVTGRPRPSRCRASRRSRSCRRSSASVMQVAVACSATNDGARNLTRHGFGPPSETT